MATTSKQPAKPARKGNTTLQSPKPPRRIFEPNRPADCYRGAIHKRWEVDPRTVERR